MYLWSTPNQTYIDVMHHNQVKDDPNVFLPIAKALFSLFYFLVGKLFLFLLYFKMERHGAMIFKPHLVEHKLLGRSAVIETIVSIVSLNPNL